jgi:hypothetical protein
MSALMRIRDSSRTSREVRKVPATDSRAEGSIGAIAVNHHTDVEQSGSKRHCHAIPKYLGWT